MQTIPQPIVDWETVVRMSDPLRKPSRQRLRTLKEGDRVSAGIRVVTRRAGRVSGSSVFYSAATALAVQARQSGDEDTAARLSRSGARIESWVATALQTFLSSHSIDELQQAPFYADLVARTATAVDVFFASSELLVAGQIKAVRDGSAQIAGTNAGRRVRVDLPSALTAQAGSSRGDFVWVMRCVVESAAIVTVIPAVEVATRAKTPSPPRPVGANIGGRRKAVPSSGYLESGPGAPITSAEAEFFANLDKDALPTARVLRPVG